MSTQLICKLGDIIPETGVCALVNNKQVAIFRTIDDKLFAIDNFDPFSKANVLSRGLLGGTTITINDNNAENQQDAQTISSQNPAATESDEFNGKNSKEVIYVASPVYKQRFDLATGQCLDDDGVSLTTYNVKLSDDDVVIEISDMDANLEG